MGDERSKVWSFIIYPDSENIPSDWLDILFDLGVPGALSPIHDRDVDGDGEVKKAHYHVVLVFSSKKSFNQVQDISNKFSGVKPMRVNDTRYMIRYLIHKDSPNKFQYNKTDLVTFGGFEIDKYFDSINETYQIIGEIMDYIDESKNYSFYSLVRYARENNEDWWHLLVDKKTLFFSTYLKSFKFEQDLKERNEKHHNHTTMMHEKVISEDE